MKAALARFDLYLTEAVQKLPRWLRPLMKTASLVGQPVAMGALLVLCAGNAWLLQQDDQVAAYIAAFIVLPIASVIKLGVHRTRPATYIRTRLPSYSFPSGHAYGTLLTFGLIAWAVGTPISIALSSIIIFLIGLSRIYLGAHFPSDVAGGWLFAILAVVVIARTTGL